MPLTLLQPSNDIVFKMLFAAPNSQESLTALLKAVLKPANKIKIATIKNPEIPKNEAAEKGIILDILVELTDGSLIDVEMQVVDTKNIWLRALYYWARIYANQLQRGEDYRTLKPTTVIFILNFEQFPDIPLHFHHVFMLQHLQLASYTHPHLRLDFVELPKLPSAEDEASESGAPAHEQLTIWRRFLLNPEAADLQELIMTDPIFKKTKEQLEAVSNDPEARRLAQLREDARRNYDSSIGIARSEGEEIGLKKGIEKGIEIGKRKGLEEGIEKGRQQALEDVVYILSHQGIDVEKIAQILNLEQFTVANILTNKTKST